MTKTVRRRAASAAVLILRSAHAQALPQSRTRVRASRRMRTATAWALVLRDASQRTCAVEAPALASGCDAPQHEGEHRGRRFGQTKPPGRRTNLRLQETIAGRAPLFPDCYLQWIAQLQRVEPQRAVRSRPATTLLAARCRIRTAATADLIHAFTNRLASACETPDMRNLRNLFFATPRHEKLSRGRPSSWW